MSATLATMEKEVLEEGREWTRRRLQERLQQAADRIPAVCGQSGLVQNHRDHLNYADLAARDAPIGSGSMESACSQFQDRLKRRGQFWSPRGLANMLDVDVAVKNDTLEFLWN